MTHDAHDQLQRLRIRLGFVSSDEAQLGRIGGRYEVVKELAEGGMGKVFLVRDTRFDTPEAIVALKLVESRDATLQDRLWREAHALLSLRKSRHVVPVYDVDKHEGSTFFTMRHVEGGTLRAWQADKSLPEIVDAYLAAAEGLCDAHERGIVHRDFKPDNVLVEGHEVMVADFGLAASAGLASRDELAVADERPGKPSITIGGTLPYMAPEQFAGEPADAKTDQFAFCVALWEACAGCLPWQWRRASEQAEAMRGPAMVRRELPGWLRRALVRGMAFDRKARFADMRTLTRQLARGRRRRARLIKIGAGVGAFVVTLALGGLAAFDPPQACDAFVAMIDTHWPSDATLDERARARLDELVEGWRDDARRSCSEGLAPSPTDRERRCMEGWLHDLDLTVDQLARTGDSLELVEALTPTSSYCELRKIDLDPLVRDELVRARASSLAGEAEDADRHLALAERWAELAASTRATPDQDQGPTLEQAEIDVARVELLARANRLEEARAALERAEASTERYHEPRGQLRLLWAKVLAVTGDEADRALAFAPYHEAVGLSFGATGLRAAELRETEGHVLRASGRLESAAQAFVAAAEQFDALRRPFAAARARQNAGAALQEAGDLAGAATHYHDVLAILTPLDVPRSPVVLTTRLELATVMRDRIEATSDPLTPEVACRDALAQLELVVEHAEPKLRLEALGRAVRFIGETEQFDELPRWQARLEQALAGPDSFDLFDPDLRAQVEIQLALTLVFAGDPTGEPRVLALLDDEATQTSMYFEALVTAWLEWLDEQRRCEARVAVITRFPTISIPPPNNCTPSSEATTP